MARQKKRMNAKEIRQMIENEEKKRWEMLKDLDDIQPSRAYPKAMLELHKHLARARWSVIMHLHTRACKRRRYR